MEEQNKTDMFENLCTILKCFQVRLFKNSARFRHNNKENYALVVSLGL